MGVNFREYVFGDPYWGWLWQGVAYTLIITIITSILSLIMGFLVCQARISSKQTLSLLGRFYVNVFRNLPPVPLLLFLGFGLPQTFQSLFHTPWPRDMDFPILLAGLSLNTSSYIGEILHSGVRGVPRGQWESGRVLGLSPFQVLFHLIYPQALRVAFPALGNRLVHNMKNSTVALVLPLSVDSMEVMGQVARIAGQTFAWAEPLIFAATIHLALAIILSFLVNSLARQTQKKVEEAR